MKRRSLVIGLIAGAVAGSGSAGSGSAGSGSAAVAGPTPATAAAFEAMFQAKNDLTWSGGDHAASFRASNGVTYWSFGDTVIGEEDPATGAYKDGWVVRSNSILRQSGDTLSGAVDGAAVPDAADGDRYWTLGMFEANGFLYVLCQRVRSTVDFFDLRGVELAKFSFQAGGKLSLVAMLDTPSTGAIGGDSAQTAQYGVDAVVKDGFVYLFGYSNAPWDTDFPHRSYVARVPVGQLESASAWRFWSGGEIWGAQMGLAEPILWAQISSVRFVGGRWVLVHKPWNGWGDMVFLELRDEPYGPTRNAVRLKSIGGPGYLTYSPQLHPEQTLGSGRLLLSISYNGVTLDEVGHDADLYKPRFFEIALPPRYLISRRDGLPRAPAPRRTPISPGIGAALARPGLSGC